MPLNILPAVGAVRLGLLIWAFVGPGLAAMSMYGTMYVREKILTASAVRAAKDQATVACNERVAQIERAHNEAIDDSVDEAILAAEAVGPTPEEANALRALCEASTSCRSRGVVR